MKNLTLESKRALSSLFHRLGISSIKEIHYIGKPWLHMNPKKLFIKYAITNRDSHISLVTILKRWSATRFSDPFLSLITQLNFWSSMIHLINQGFASFFSTRYFKVAWSMKTMAWDHMRYGLNFSNPKPTTKNSFSVTV